MLINLVGNAVKFTRPRGRVVVRVETGHRAPTVPVTLEVRDTGVGIAPWRLAMIFEAFEPGDVGVGREYGGTGLGLSISRALCRLLHCDLAVSSVVGVGSVFRVTSSRARRARVAPGERGTAAAPLRVAVSRVDHAVSRVTTAGHSVIGVESVSRLPTANVDNVTIHGISVTKSLLSE